MAGSMTRGNFPEKEEIAVLPLTLGPVLISNVRAGPALLAGENWTLVLEEPPSMLNDPLPGVAV
jgi:hypothetical protein